MSVIFAAFYADQPGKQSRAKEYLDYMRAGAVALANSTPGARYVVLTDRATAPVFDNHLETEVVVDSGIPLMLQVLAGQREFERRATADLVVLADGDAIPCLDLTHATASDIGLAITHKGEKFNRLINNVGYCRDHDLAAWFLNRASEILQSWPADKQEWFGDQEAWGAVVGPQTEWRSENHGDRFSVDIGGRQIWMYPCETHNCAVPHHGVLKTGQEHAFILHFKGPRKRMIRDFCAQRWGFQ